MSKTIPLGESFVVKELSETMPPKSKGKKKKKGKGATSKDGEIGGKEKEILTFNEVVLLYQLQAKKKQQEDLQNMIDDIQKRIKRQQDRNKVLNQEKQTFLKEAIKQAKDQEIKLQSKTEIKYDQVEEALKEKLTAAKDEEKKVEELKKDIIKLEGEISKSLKKVNENHEFRDRIQYENETHIKVLKKEMQDMRESYDELSDFFVKNLQTIKEQIKKSTKTSIDKEKKVASEQALESLDSSSHQEFSDNKWLRQEVQIHKDHLGNISAIVEELEKKNVEIMSELLDNQFEEVQVARDFFVACNSSKEESQMSDHEADDVIAIHGDVHGDEVDPSGIDWLDNYIPSFDEDPSEELKRLAPMDLKFLCITGNKLKVHQDLKNKDVDGDEDSHFDNSRRKMEWLTKGVFQSNSSQ